MGEGALTPPFGAYTPTSAQAAVIALTRGTFLRRGAFRRSMGKLVTRLRSGPVDASFHGASFRLHLHGSPTEWAMLLNPAYNAEELSFLKGALKPDDVFVDVGANIGLYSLSLARHAGRVIAVEPEPVAHERLTRNVAANDARNVQIFRTAVGDRTGEVSFIQDGVNLGHSRMGGDGGFTVPIQPLADLLTTAGVGAIGALKIDVEGFEDQVLFPFFETWPAEGRPRLVVIEHVDRPRWGRDCIDLMLSLGYVERWKDRSNTVLERSL